MHIGVVGPIHIPSISKYIDADTSKWIVGMGGTPVNHQINALLEDGHKVSVFSLSPEIEEPFEWHQENLSIYIGQYRKRARYRCVDFFKKERDYLKNSIINANPIIIHAHWQYEWAWAALDSKVPTLVTCHDSPLRVLFVQRDFYRLIRLIMSIIVLKKCKLISAVSPYTASSLRKITSKRIRVVPNFEPQQVFDFYKKRKISEGKVRIAMVNNGFYGLKNVSTGIKAFVELLKIFPQAELHLYGNGHGYNEDAYQWCKKNSCLKNVLFKGEINFVNLIADLSECHVLLHSSLEESCPMVVIEAFAIGIPVVGGEKSGGMPWMIEGHSGCLVDVNSVESILQGLIQLLKPNVLEEFSLCARELAIKKFSRKAVMQQYYSLYCELLPQKHISSFIKYSSI